MSSPRIVLVGSEEHERLKSQGWGEVHRSFGAQLDSDAVDYSELTRLVAAVGGVGSVRELGDDDVPAILELDEATSGDYPGGAATRHQALTAESATLTEQRRAFGVVTESAIIAVTFVDVNGERAETDFTVVDPEWRGRGLGVAVKAASILALIDSGVRVFRTGGSTENAGIRAANGALGYKEDEEWVTLEMG